MNRFNKIIYWHKILTAKLAGGDYTWNITLPAYSASDGNPPQEYYPQVLLFVEPCKDNLSGDRDRDAEWFSVTGDSDLFAPGSILALNNSNDMPTVTVTQDPEEHEYLAFKTNKTGQIMDAGTILYTNIAFDYTVQFLDGREQYYPVSTSLNLPMKRAVMFRRTGVTDGMVFQDLTQGVGAVNVWKISLVDYREKIMVLYLENPDRGG